MINIVPLTKENEEKWNDFINSHEKATFFHTLEWRDIIKEVYGFEPMYFMAFDENGKVQAIFPSFYTKSFLFGKKIISTPFNFYNGPLFKNEKAGEALINYVIKIAKERNVKYVELKFMDDISEELERKVKLKKKAHYYISNLELAKTVEETEKKYKTGVKRTVRRRRRNAERDGIAIRDMEDIKELESFYDVMVGALRDKHNMISQPYKLFYLLTKRLEPKNMVKVLLAVKGKEVGGGIILLLFKDRAIYAWGASNLKYQIYSPSSLLVDSAIKYCISKGYKALDFGVTSPYQESLLSFKESWGCSHKKLPYYYSLIKAKEIPELDYHISFRGIRKLFKYVPVSIIKIISPIVTKQLG